jgi:hypothetical protein
VGLSLVWSFPKRMLSRYTAQAASNTGTAQTGYHFASLVKVVIPKTDYVTIREFLEGIFGA